MTPPDQPISKDALYYGAWAVAVVAGLLQSQRLLMVLRDIRDLLKK